MNSEQKPTRSPAIMIEVALVHIGCWGEVEPIPGHGFHCLHCGQRVDLLSTAEKLKLPLVQIDTAVKKRKDGKHMHVAIVRMEIKPEYREQFESIMARSSKVIDGVKGLVEFRVLRTKGADLQYATLSVWESEEARQNFSTSEASVTYHSEINELRDAFLQAPQLEAFEVLDF